MKLPNLMIRLIRKGLKGVIPSNWQLPFEYYLYILGEPEKELVLLEKICRERNVAIDIGANIGLYSYKMSKLFSKVYAFECNQNLAHFMASFTSKKITVIPKGLSSNASNAILYIPIKQNIPLTGWASLSKDNDLGISKHIEQKVELIKLDSLNICPVDLVKIDVEGHELQVLEGAENTLSKHKPVVIIEVKHDKKDPVFRFLSRMGYIQAKLEELAGQSGTADNYIFFATV